MKPAWGPKAMPAIITIPVIALKLGTGMATRPATASAAITARITNSRAWGRLASNTRKKGAIASRITRVLVR